MILHFSLYIYYIADQIKFLNRYLIKKYFSLFLRIIIRNKSFFFLIRNGKKDKKKNLYFNINSNNKKTDDTYKIIIMIT